MESGKNVDSFVLYQKQADMQEYAYKIFIKYPKSERLGLIQDMKKSIHEGIRVTVYINKIYRNRERKLDLLNRLDAELQMQKLFVRMSYKNKYISDKNYKEWTRRLDEIGRIIGGLMRVPCQKE